LKVGYVSFGKVIDDAPGGKPAACSMTTPKEWIG